MSPHPALGVTYASLGALGVQGGIEVARTAEQLGYRSFWVAEANGTEAFSLLGAAGAAAPSLDLGTGVLALQLRTPPLVAMAAATLQALHPEREIIIGVGISSPVVVGRWHGAPYLAKRPLAQTREYVTLLRECLSGESVSLPGRFLRGQSVPARSAARRPAPEDRDRRPERGDAPARRRGRRRRAAQLHPGQSRPVVGRAGAQGRRRDDLRVRPRGSSPIVPTASTPPAATCSPTRSSTRTPQSFTRAGYRATRWPTSASATRRATARERWPRFRPDGRRHRRHGRRRHSPRHCACLPRRRRGGAGAHAASVGQGPDGGHGRDDGGSSTSLRGERGDRGKGRRRDRRRERHRSRAGSAIRRGRAAGVVVADVDADGAAAVAADIAGSGGTAIAVPTNVGVEAEVIGLVERAEATYGPIDLFCANAGIGVGRGPETSDDDWERIWRVNTMSHVYAARALLPGWLARGEGYFLADRISRGTADPDRLGAVRSHQARGRRVRRVAVGDLRRRRHQGLVPLPAGRAHQHAAQQRRRRPRAGRCRSQSGRGRARARRRGRRGREDDRRGGVPGAPPSRGAHLLATQDRRLRPVAARDASAPGGA